MKALTIKQPWLYAITDLNKRIENRTWKPPEWIIGQRIGLHASREDDLSGFAAFRDITGVDAPHDLPRGCIVSTARVVGFCNHSEDDWFVGPYGWVLDDISKVFPGPVSCRGALGLWDVPFECMPSFHRP